MGGQGAGTAEGNPEMIKQNARLRQAVGILNEKLESERAEFDKTLDELQKSMEQIEQLQISIDELKKLEGVVKTKDEELEELKIQLDENQEAVGMVERMSDEILEKEKQISELRRSLKELKEVKELDDTLVEELDQHIKNLQDVITGKEFEAYEFRRKVEEQDTAIEEGNNRLARFKEKAQLMARQNEMLRQELEELSKGQGKEAESEKVRKIEKLMNRQYELNNERRELYKKYIRAVSRSAQYKAEAALK